MSLTIREKLKKDVGWKWPFLYLGFFAFITPGFWILQFIIYQVKFENKFFSYRFYKITYYIGLFFGISFIFIYTIGFLIFIIELF